MPQSAALSQEQKTEQKKFFSHRKPLANPSVENREKKSARFEIARLTWESFADLKIKSEDLNRI